MISPSNLWGSTYDVSFTGAKLSSSDLSAITGIETAANLTGGMLLGVSIVVGAASDGLNGGVKGAVTSLSAMEGAELGVALFGVVAGGFTANVISSYLYDDAINHSSAGNGELSPGFLAAQNNPDAFLGTATVGASMFPAVDYLQQTLQYQ